MDPFEKALDKAGFNQNKSGIARYSGLSGNQLNTADIVYSETKRQVSNLETLRQRRVISSDFYSLEAEPFKILRTRVLKSLRTNQWNSFAVTAPTKNAGKTLVSVNLAIAMANEVNQTVMLVDLDLRAPKIDWYLDLKVENGLSEYLVSDIPLSSVLVNPGFDRLVVLPNKTRVDGASELITGHKMRALVEELKTRYRSRIIIFDLPPVLMTDDVLSSADYFDAFLLVVEEGGNTPQQVKKALKVLSGTPLLGTVLNKTDSKEEYHEYY